MPHCMARPVLWCAAVKCVLRSGALGRLFLDQVVFAPVFIAAFFSVLCTIDVRLTRPHPALGCTPSSVDAQLSTHAASEQSSSSLHWAAHPTLLTHSYRFADAFEQNLS